MNMHIVDTIISEVEGGMSEMYNTASSGFGILVAKICLSSSNFCKYIKGVLTT